jgi:hypothetical protein
MQRDLMDFRAAEIASDSRPSTFNSQRKIPKCPFCKAWCNMFLDAFWHQIMIVFCRVMWYYILSGIRPDWIEIGPPICSCRNEGIPNNESLVNQVSGGWCCHHKHYDPVCCQPGLASDFPSQSDWAQDLDIMQQPTEIKMFQKHKVIILCFAWVADMGEYPGSWKCGMFFKRWHVLYTQSSTGYPGMHFEKEIHEWWIYGTLWVSTRLIGHIMISWEYISYPNI